MFDGAGQFVEEYVLTQLTGIASPDGEFLATVPFDGTGLTAYRLSDLRAGLIQPVSAFAPPGEFVYDVLWSATGQLGLGVAQPGAVDVYVWDPDTGLAAGQPVVLDNGRCEFVFLSDFSPAETQLYLGDC